jgi:hypothetical protein
MRTIRDLTVRLTSNAYVIINGSHEEGNVTKRNIFWKLKSNWTPKKQAISRRVRHLSRNLMLSWFFKRGNEELFE